jgi:DNA-binding NtrC family response regulator
MSLEGCVIGLIDENPGAGASLAQGLRQEGADVVCWRSKSEAIEGIARTRPGAVVCDMEFTAGWGADIFRAAAALPDAPPFLFVDGASVNGAERMPAGTRPGPRKPFDIKEFLPRLERLLRPQTRPQLGISAAMRRLEDELQGFARSSGRLLLLQGEIGVGKEVVARHFHGLFGGNGGSFIAVNCAGLSSAMDVASLFEGADAVHRGQEASALPAHRGTLFLDEVDALARAQQAQLLRMLEGRRDCANTGGVQAGGGLAPRIVCSTHADLRARTVRGLFRADLLALLEQASLHVPPLRERSEDIAWLLTQLFAELLPGRRNAIQGFSREALAAALAYAWPGNIRELRNRAACALALAQGPWISPGELQPELPAAAAPARRASLQEARDGAERKLIGEVLAANGGALGATARALDVSRTTLWKKIQRLKIDAGNTMTAAADFTK